MLELFCSLPVPFLLPVTRCCLQSPQLQGLGYTQLLELSLQFSFTETHVLNVLTMQAATLSLTVVLERIDYFVYIKVLTAEKV